MEELVARAAREIAAQWHTGELVWAAVGMAAQGAFFARFFVQWLASERVRKSIVPHSFWYASLGGGLLLMTYAIHRRDTVFTLSQAAGVLIYLRNVHLVHKDWRKRVALTAAVFAAAAALVAVAYGAPASVRLGTTPEIAKLETRTWGHAGAWWIAFGIAGSTIFFMRFVIQWVASERRHESVMPVSFWYVSVIGGLMLLVYVVHVRDVVLAVGQTGGMLVYLRNIVLSRGERGKNIAFVVLLSILSGLLFFVGIDSVALWASNEGRTAQIAREMYATGDYIVPHVNTRVALTKPPLYHWLASSSYGVFGIGEFAARFPSAAAGLLTVLATYFLCRRIFGGDTGFLAGVMTATGIDFVWNARAARPDMVYTFLVVAAIVAFVYAVESERCRRALFMLFFACMGLAVMAKGPAGLFLPLVSGAAYLRWSGRKVEISRMTWAAGTLVFLAITVPWHVAVSLSVDAAGLKYYFWGQLARWSMGKGALRSAWDVLLSLFLYVPYLFKGFFPWSFFLPAAIWTAAASVREKRDRYLALVLVWFLAGIVAFSLSGTKAARYMLPLLPAGAIIVAYLWREALGGAGNAGSPQSRTAARLLKASLWPMVVTNVLLAVVIAWAGQVNQALRSAGLLARLNSMDSYMADVWTAFFRAHPWAFGMAAVFLCLASAGALAGAYRWRFGYSFGLLAVVVTGYLGVFHLVLVPKAGFVYDVRPFAAKLERLARGAPYGWAGDASLEMLFYMDRRYDRLRPEDVKRYMEKNPNSLVLLWEKDLGNLPPEALGGVKVLMRGRVKHRVAVVLGSPWRPPDPAGSGGLNE